MKKNKVYVGPQIRAARVIVSRDVARRLDRVVERVGNAKVAAKLLGVGECTVENALEQGTLLASTLARLEAALAAEETKAKREGAA